MIELKVPRIGLITDVEFQKYLLLAIAWLETKFDETHVRAEEYVGTMDGQVFSVDQVTYLPHGEDLPNGSYIHSHYWNGRQWKYEERQTVFVSTGRASRTKWTQYFHFEDELLALEFKLAVL